MAYRFPDVLKRNRVAFGEQDTAPVENTYLQTVIIQNREFQRYAIDNLINLVPVDEASTKFESAPQFILTGYQDEAERLEMQHRMLEYVFDNRLIFPYVPNPRRVLDCGYGAASWAIEVAEQYPSCDVIGVDISTHLKPDETPDNLWLQLDDLNEPFTFHSNTFDVVHSRLVASGINRDRWPGYVRDISRHYQMAWMKLSNDIIDQPERVLKPGGWLQMVEMYFNCQSDNGSLTPANALRQWSENYMRSVDDIKDPRAATRLPNLMSATGLVNVESRMIPLPTSSWSSDPRDRNIGEKNRENVHRLLSTVAVYPFTQRLGMSYDEFQVLIASARQEARDSSLKAYFPL
ncbi:MAG: hypothetical protein M1834_000086 [Cirrosporium novae-zelandiae]|nr:MAG: hypothetical protein M1834_000086 [Cirrosporium novae-zelandiae]